MFRNIRNRLFPILCLIVFLLYGVLRVSTTIRSLDSLRIHSDTKSYLRIAGSDIFSPDFYADGRPFGFPLLLKVARGNKQTTAILQTLISILCWSAFAYVLALQLHSPALRIAAFLIPLLLSLGHFVSAWDTVILTESLSLSLLALLLAGWLWLLSGWSWLKAILLVGISFAWAFTRDTNYWLLLLISLFTLVTGIFVARRWLKLGGIFFIIFFLANLASNHGGRWVFPFQNILATRILHDPSAVEYFSNCGMPVTPELLSLSGGNASSNDRAFYDDPQLSGYRDWLDVNGRTCYLRWLASRPSVSLILPLQEFPALVAFNAIDRFYAKNYQPQLPRFLETILYPPINGLIVLVGLVLVLVVTGLQKAWCQKPLWIVWVGVIILLYPHLFLVWHGDTLGLDRHALALIVQYYLAIWLALLLALDWIHDRQKAQ